MYEFYELSMWQAAKSIVSEKLCLFITFPFFQLVLLRILLKILELRDGKGYLFTKLFCLFYLPLLCNCKYSFLLPELHITHKRNYYSHTILCRVNNSILAQSRYSWVLLSVSRHQDLTRMERISHCWYNGAHRLQAHFRINVYLNRFG